MHSEKNGLPEGRDARPGSDTATLRSLDFLARYSPLVQYAWNKKLEEETKKLITAYRAEHGTSKSVPDTAITNDPDYKIQELQLYKEIRAECDDLQKKHDIMMSLSSLEEKLKARAALLDNRHAECDAKSDELHEREVALKGKELEYAKRAQFLIEVEQEHGAHQDFYAEASKQLAAERASLEHLRDVEIPALKNKIEEDTRQVRETVLGLVERIRAYDKAVEQALKNPSLGNIDVLNATKIATDRAAETTLDLLLTALKPGDAAPARQPSAPAEGNA